MLQFSDRLKNLKEYYFSVKLREVNKLIKSGQNIINMAIGNPDISPHKNVKKALSDSLKFDKSHMYQSYQGIPELRSSISLGRSLKSRLYVLLRRAKVFSPSTILFENKDFIFSISFERTFLSFPELSINKFIIS